MSSESMNYIDHKAKPGSFIGYRTFEKGRGWSDFWGILLLKLDEVSPGHQTVVTIGAYTAYSKYDQPRFIKGLFDGSVMKDHLISELMGRDQYESTLKVRENLSEWQQKAEDWVLTNVW